RRRPPGAQPPPSPPMVPGGPPGALPHAEPRDAVIPDRVLVIVDWGARLDGYCSDCTRTLATGPLDAEASEVYDLVLEAQRAGLEAGRAGVSGREADLAAREGTEAAGPG